MPSHYTQGPRVVRIQRSCSSPSKPKFRRIPNTYGKVQGSSNSQVLNKSKLVILSRSSSSNKVTKATNEGKKPGTDSGERLSNVVNQMPPTRKTDGKDEPLQSNYQHQRPRSDSISILNSDRFVSLRNSFGTLNETTQYQRKRKHRKGIFSQCCACSPLWICASVFALLLVALALAALLVGLLVGLQRTTTLPSTIKPSRFYENLVINGDGETGPCDPEFNVTSPTAWSYNGPITQVHYNRTIVADQTPTTPGPNDRGQCYFYGQISGSTSMWQTVNLVDYADPLLIDSQRIKYNFSAWIGGIAGQDDHAIVSISFADRNHRPVGSTTSLGPVYNVDRSGQTALVFRQTIGGLPIRARFITVVVTIIRVAGAFSNGNVDNIAVYLYE